VQRFVHRENLNRYRQSLAHTSDEAERQCIMRLLSEEECQAIKDEPPEPSPRDRIR
jgi:hypothetical protein